MKYVKAMLITFLLLSAAAVSFSGCASTSYSQGFDEAD